MYALLSIGIPFSIQAQHQQWEVIDLNFTVDQSVTDPFDVAFGAVFNHENGSDMHVPGFFNGDGTWTIRFSPPEAGKWTYKTSASLPELAGQTGTLDITENTKEQQHGPVKIDSEHPQKFIHADSESYFMMAYEINWLFALDAQNPTDIPKTRELMGVVKDHGFNQVVMNVYAYDAPWGEKEKIKPENNYANPAIFPFAGSNENPDYSTLSLAFFQHLDRVIEHLDDQQMVARLMIYVWNKMVNWPEPGSKADNLYFDYVIKRYQAYPNIIWDIAKEALSYGRDDTGYITSRIDRVRRLDGHDRLLTVHSYKYCDAFPDKVDFISIPDNQPYLYARMREVLAKHSSEPVVNIEHGAYEKTMHSLFDGAYTDPLTCLDRMYQCLFAGTYSNYYWQNTAWYNVITNPLELPQEQQPHLHYYKNIRKLFEPYNFNELYPVQNMFAAPMLTNGEDTFIFYLPEHRTRVAGRLPELRGKTVNVKWFDPLNGKFHPAKDKTFGDDTWLAIDRPDGFTGSLSIAILSLVRE